jgi:hypothetical protein
LNFFLFNLPPCKVWQILEIRKDVFCILQVWSSLKIQKEFDLGWPTATTPSPLHQTDQRRTCQPHTTRPCTDFVRHLATGGCCRTTLPAAARSGPWCRVRLTLIVATYKRTRTRWRIPFSLLPSPKIELFHCRLPPPVSHQFHPPLANHELQEDSCKLTLLLPHLS